MSSARIHYTFHSDATAERELDALVAVYTLALRKFYESKEAAAHTPMPGGRDGTKVQGDDSADARIIPE
jgi:hypothetical protein